MPRLLGAQATSVPREHPWTDRATTCTKLSGTLPVSQGLEAVTGWLAVTSRQALEGRDFLDSEQQAKLRWSGPLVTLRRVWDARPASRFCFWQGSVLTNHWDVLHPPWPIHRLQAGPLCLTCASTLHPPDDFSSSSQQPPMSTGAHRLRTVRYSQDLSPGLFVPKA